MSCEVPGEPPAQPASTVLPWGHSAVIQMWIIEKFLLSALGTTNPINHGFQCFHVQNKCQRQGTSGLSHCNVLTARVSPWNQLDSGPPGWKEPPATWPPPVCHKPPPRESRRGHILFTAIPYTLRLWFSMKIEFILTIAWPELSFLSVYSERYSLSTEWDYAQIPQRITESGIAASKEPCCSSNSSSATNFMTVEKLFHLLGLCLTMKITKRPKGNISSKLF